MAPAADDMVGDYRISWLAEKLHSIPRIDMSLHRVGANFQLASQHYKEVSESAIGLTLLRPVAMAPCMWFHHHQIYTADRKNVLSYLSYCMVLML